MEKLLEQMKEAITKAKELGYFWNDADWAKEEGYLISFADLSIIIKRIEYLESKIKDV